MAGEELNGVKSQGRFTVDDMSIGPSVHLDPGPMGQFSADDAVAVPYDDKPILSEHQRLGVGPDKSPVYNVQAVPSNERMLMQLFLDGPQEKAAYVRKYLGNQYEIALHPRLPSEIIIRKKGEKAWGVIDPGGASLDELLPEVMENLDSVAQMALVPSGVLAGAATTGGIQGVRQALRKALMPELDTQVDKVVVDAVGGSVAGGITGKITSTAKKGVQEVITKSGKIVQQTADTVGKNESGIIQKLGKWLNITETPEFIAKEMGATGKQLDPTNPKLLVNKIANLQKEHPEFMAAYKAPGAWTLKGKFKNLAQLSDDAGEQVSQFIAQNADVEVNVKDILSSKAFRDLEKAAKTRKVTQGKNTVIANRKAKQQFQRVKQDFLDDLGTAVLGEAESPGSIMNLYRKKELINTDLAKELGAKTNDEALMAIIGDKGIPIGDVWALRLGRDQIINYGKKQGQISAKNTVDKFTADALRQAMQITASNLPDGAALIKAQNLYSELYPVLKTMGAKIGADAADIWNPIKILPGVINSAPRFAARLGVNLANKVEVRAFAEGLAKGKFPLPPDVTLPTAPRNLGKFLGQTARAAKFNFTTGFLEQNAQADLLPRNAEMYFENPEALNGLLNSIEADPELTDAVVKSFERGDLDTFSNMLSYVASENELQFDTAPFKSLVMKEGTPVIMDKYDREQYRQWVEKNVLNIDERFEILNALNADGTMLQEPFKPPTLKIKGTPRQPTQEKATPTSRTASKLKSINTVEVDDDGTERADHGY